MQDLLYVHSTTVRDFFFLSVNVVINLILLVFYFHLSYISEIMYAQGPGILAVIKMTQDQVRHILRIQKKKERIER